MRKTNNKSQLFSVAYLLISCILCLGIVSYIGNGGTEQRKTYADVTERQSDDSEIVIGEEEVPLAGAPKVSVKKTKKTSTKKTKMKKAAKKTKTVTKTKTSKKKSTSKTVSVQTVKETTVLTTTKTKTKKKSKVKTIQTTVETTVKTTQTNIAVKTNSGSSTNASGNAGNGFAVSKFSDINGKVDAKVYNAFVKLGFGFKINSSLTTTGVFSVKNHNIQLKRGQSSYLLHELGHFVSALKNDADATSEWKSIYNAEKGSYVGNNKSYVTKTASEYFAESFRDYSENASALKNSRPKTYSFIKKTVDSISDSDVAGFEDLYGWYWE